MAKIFQNNVFVFQASKLLISRQTNNSLLRTMFNGRTQYRKPRYSTGTIGWLALATGTLLTGVGTVYYHVGKMSWKRILHNPLKAASKGNVVTDENVSANLSRKQVMFAEYASYEFGGELLMSPQDFLKSLVDLKQASSQRKRKALDIEDVNNILKSNRSLPKNKEDLFTYMGERGLITYPEYLFLLTLLTKSSHGLHVAFRMLDLDGNETLGKAEFQELEKMLNRKSSKKSLVKPDESLNLKELPSTSLLIHFFGASGNGQLTFTDMLQFTRNLQKEFWKREFFLHSGHKEVIDGVKFGKLLMQSTQLGDKDIEDYIERLKGREGDKINVTFQDYVKFGEFLNNLEEFSISLKIYNVANQPVTQEEFKRAVRISTGDALADHIVNTIFLLFDIDGDGKLSQKEFLGLMKDRVNKRFAAKDTNIGMWDGFVNCVRNEVID